MVANGSAGSFGCFGGDVAETFTGGTFEETAAQLCAACTSDVKCDGWAMHDSNTTGFTLHNGKEMPPPQGTKHCTAMSRGVPVSVRCTLDAACSSMLHAVMLHAACRMHSTSKGACSSPFFLDLCFCV